MAMTSVSATSVAACSAIRRLASAFGRRRGQHGGRRRDRADHPRRGPGPGPRHRGVPTDRGARDDHEYARETRSLRSTLELLCEGAIRGLFDGQSSIDYDEATSVLSLDISALDGDADNVVAAAMMCSSAWTSTMVESCLASGRRRNVVEVSDELWRRLRAAPGLVELSDRVTRLNRAHGVVSLQITHSLSDLEAPPPRPIGPRPGAWPPATASSSSVASTPPNSTGSAPSPPHLRGTRPDHLVGSPTDVAPGPHAPRPRQVPDQVR